MVKRLIIFGATCLIGCFIATVLLVTSPSKRISSKSYKDHELDEKKNPEKKWMEFDNFLDGTFRANSFYPRWVSGEEYVYKTNTGAINRVNISSGVDEEIFGSDAWANNPSGPFAWSLSPDQLYITISYNQIDGYAHYVRTFSCDIYEVSTGNKVGPDIPTQGIQKLQWSTSGHDLSYVYGFNVYIYKNTFNDNIQVTSDGDEQLVFNGISDWLFSVEITDDDSLMWWSPDSRYMAYATIRQENVTQFEFAVYNNYQYPEMIKLPYPKPGTPIPRTSITVFDVQNSKVTTITTSDFSTWADGYYLNSVTWRGNSTLSPLWKNRISNEAVVEDCAPPDFTCTHVSEMRSTSTTGWLGHYKVSHVFPTNNDEIYMTVRSNSGFPHVAVFNVTSNKYDWRTSGDFEVTDTSSGYDAIHFYDQPNDWIYFTSTELESTPGTGLPRIRHLWRVKGFGADKRRNCITCDLDKNRCNWVTPSFSTDGTFVVINCGGSGNAPPISELHKRNAKGDYEFFELVEDNADLVNTLNGYYFRDRIYGSLNLPGVNGEWFYMLQLPPNFDENKKYPLLVQVYSGPGYQEVEERFGVSWKDYISSARDVVVMSFDGRGTGFRGDNIMHMVYKKLGQYEPLDQIAAAKFIANDKAYIDETRLAVWGWSYGGYATSRVIGEDVENVFKCGFAVAPVTKWEYYHTIYTERYMLQPKNNLEGYSKSTTLQGIDSFRSHHFNLFHGTRDENVHFQNSAQLSKFLIAGDVRFGAFFAADDDHGMNRVPNNYRNIYKMLTRELEICFEL